MLEDATLERMLGDAADVIAVPEAGPERILATRDAISPPRKRDARPRLQGARRHPVRATAALVASVVVVGGIAGVVSGSGGGNVNSSASRVASTGIHAAGGALPVAAPAVGSGTNVSGQASTAAPLQAGAIGAAQQTTPNLVPGSTEAKVVKNGSMTLQVGSVESTVERLMQLAGTFRGYVASRSTSVPGGGRPSSGDLTMRVPEAAFESFAAQVQSLGTPSEITISGQDVTSQYADLKARLQALQSTISQLQLIESKAQTIGDVLAVEQQISSEQTQADQIQGQINVLDDETTYGSLSVHLVEPSKKGAVAPPPPSGISKAWDHARHSFARGVEAVIGALGGVAVFLLFTGVVLGFAWGGWSFLRRRLV